MKKRDKRQQAKLEKISLKRAQYEKARKQKIAAAKNSRPRTKSPSVEQ